MSRAAQDRPGPGARLVVAQRAGMLGNRLFLSAHLLAHAIDRGLVLRNPAFAGFADSIGSWQGDVWCRHPVEAGSGRPVPPWRRRALCLLCEGLSGLLWQTGGGRGPLRAYSIERTFDAQDGVCDLGGPDFSRRVATGGWLLLRGWKFRDFAALDRHGQTVRETFRPVPKIRRRVEEAVGRARRRGGRLVGVHIRRGDYRDWQGGRYFFELARYADWLREALTLWPGEQVSFLVCSNEDIPPTLFEGLPVTPGPGGAVEDLYALAACDFLLGPPSTFTLWASFYGGAPLHMVLDGVTPLHPASFRRHPHV